MNTRISIDAGTVGGMAITGTLSGLVVGARRGSHIGIVLGRAGGTNGSVVFGTLFGLIGAVGGAALGTAVSMKHI